MLVAKTKKRLVFISPVFLFPNDAGGKIRTANILRGMKGGAFIITLVCPASANQAQKYGHEIGSVCDEFVPWHPAPERPKWRRAIDLLDTLPVNVTSDRTAIGAKTVSDVCKLPVIDIVVFDFVHSSVLMPPHLPFASLCFTHNVEAEIFKRHSENAQNLFDRWLWSSQYKKMERFERQALARFTSVIAVSSRDAQFFSDAYGIENAQAIPTGVDLEFFGWQAPTPVSRELKPTVVFTGSMDWAANIGGVEFFLKYVWPLVLVQESEARFLIVGRNPPASLISLANSTQGVELTGFVDDVRPYVHSAHAFVIPLLVGGGTRIKAFEAMAMGCPIVSTKIGTEGLGAVPELHFLERDDPHSMAQAILTLFNDSDLRNRLSVSARKIVEEKFGHRVASQVFEDTCMHAIKLYADQVVAGKS